MIVFSQVAFFDTYDGFGKMEIAFSYRVAIQKAITESYFLCFFFVCNHSTWENRIGGPLFFRTGNHILVANDPQWGSKTARTRQESHGAESSPISALGTGARALIQRICPEEGSVNIYDGFGKKEVNFSHKNILTKMQFRIPTCVSRYRGQPRSGSHLGYFLPTMG